MHKLFLKMMTFFLVIIASTRVIAGGGGTHFIVLIDDSEAFKSQLNRIAETLPEVLFEGLQKKQSVGTAIPTYRPRTDHLSLVFFGLTKSPQSCMKSDPLSVKPEHLFHWEPVPTDLHTDKFRKFLEKSLNKACRFKSSVSPRFTAESLILPFVQTQLSSDLFFSRTVLLLLGHDNYDKQRDLTHESNDYLEDNDVKNNVHAKDLADLVAEKFHFDRPVEGIFTVQKPETFLAGGRKENKDKLKNASPLVYRMTEFQPQIPKPEALSEYRPEIKLDRVAVSNQKLHIVPKEGEAAAVLRMSASEALQPIEVSLLFADNEKKSWQLGPYEFPQYKILTLEDCDFCIKQADGIRLPLFKIMAPALSLALDDKPLEPGTLHFSIRFRYDTGGVYDYAVYDTPLHNIALLPNPPLTIPEGLIFPAVVLDNTTLAGLWKISDTNGLSQEQALQDIKTDRLILVGAIVLLFIGLVLFLYALFSKYPFKPEWEWTAADHIALNFNQQAETYIKIGTLTLHNTGNVFGLVRWLVGLNKRKVHWSVRWLIALLGKEPSQPSRSAKLSLALDKPLNEYGLDIDNNAIALGFKSTDTQDGDATKPLQAETNQTVSDETSIDIFLATQAITDFKQDREITSSEHFSLEIAASVQMVWQETKFFVRKKPGHKSTPIAFNLQLVPEQATPPQVFYEPIADQKNCCFDLGQAVWVGTLRFESCALHQFAVPFKGDFTVQAYRDNSSIDSKAIVIEGGEQFTILPFQKEQRKKVSILCDGQIVPNPILDPVTNDLKLSSQPYSLGVEGQFAQKLDTCRFDLHRDPTPTEIELDIIQSNRSHQIFWGGDERPRIQGALTEEPLENNILNLTAQNLAFNEITPAMPLFEIKIGNTGKAGLGLVRVTITKQELESELKTTHIQLSRDRDEAELFQLVNKANITFINAPIEVKDGEKPITCIVKLNTPIIKHIVEARIDKDKATAVVELKIEIIDDVGKQKPRHLTLRNPVGLKKLPHPNWLCIDFGTSAITAALGQANDIRLLRLQKIVAEENPHLNLADYDPYNEEAKNPNLLPSYVACDADLRQIEDLPQTDNPDSNSPTPRPGFPSYRVKKLPSPGEAAFLGLPAGRAKREQSPGRIIFSLKSWLSQLSLHEIVLPEAVTFQLNQKTVKRKELPLEETVESGFAALAEAYLLAFPDFKVGRAVICHPNSFSYLHKERLRRVAVGALSQRLGIALPDERIKLISESEAVAYYYCRQRLQQYAAPLPESENLLIYDFGAGTVDLSLIRVEWNQAENFPKSWQIKNTLGVPIAGNYLDSILARLIDKSLKDIEALQPELFRYRFPVVGTRLKDGEEADHRRAIYNLWMAIRETKQHDENTNRPAWGPENNPFCVNLGNPKQDGLVEEAEPGSMDQLEELNVSEQPSTPCLRFHDANVYLCIPEKDVHDYPPLQEFIAFITETVIAELLNGANINATAVNTVVISGRGALWPGLHQKIEEIFPGPDKPDFIKDKQHAKEAVVRGAVAWQQLVQGQIEIMLPPPAPLGILLDGGTRLLKTEDEWEKGINLTGSPTFRLVELALTNPEPQSDFQSLRRYFYKLVNETPRAILWDGNPILMAKVKEENGTKTVRFENMDGLHIEVVAGGLNQSAGEMPPWPIGEILLPPETDNKG